MELAFKDVRLGEKFVSHRTMRYFGGVKIAPTEVSSEGTTQALKGPTYVGNAVILTDYFRSPAFDAGSILVMEDSCIVEVQR